MKTAAQIMKSKQFIKNELDARVPKRESDALWEKAERRLDEIMKEYGEIPKGEHTHTDTYIFPSAAIYLTLKEALDEKTAYAVIEDAAIRKTTDAGRKIAGMICSSFIQCPNAEFAKRHHMEYVLPVMCNCDHFAMQKLHATLIREGTCITSDCCDYCIVGDKSPLAAEYELVKDEDGLLLSVKKDNNK